MTNVLPAIYENGVLRLLTPFYLPEQTRVQVVLQPLFEDQQPVKMGRTETRWREFFEETARPTADFMQERVDLAPQLREIFE